MVRPHVRERLAVDFACVQLAARLADLILGEVRFGTCCESRSPPASAGKEVVLQLVSASLEGCVEERGVCYAFPFRKKRRIVGAAKSCDGRV